MRLLKFLQANRYGNKRLFIFKAAKIWIMILAISLIVPCGYSKQIPPIVLSEKEFIVFKVEISGPPHTIDGYNTGAFDATVVPPIPVTSYQWTWEIGIGAVGNNPSVNFSTPNQETTTIINAHWYARPNSRLLAITGWNCEYKINCEITVGGITCNDPTPHIWRVYLPSPPATTSWPIITGMPVIGIREVNGNDEWYVTGVGDLRRTTPEVISYIPPTSQFYYKIVIVHEGRHVEQLTSMDPWQNLFNANSLYNNTLINMTSTISEADLEQQIQNAINVQIASDKLTAEMTRIDAERDAFNQSNTAPPDYLEVDIP